MQTKAGTRAAIPLGKNIPSRQKQAMPEQMLRPSFISAGTKTFTPPPLEQRLVPSSSLWVLQSGHQGCFGLAKSWSKALSWTRSSIVQSSKSGGGGGGFGTGASSGVRSFRISSGGSAGGGLSLFRGFSLFRGGAFFSLFCFLRFFFFDRLRLLSSLRSPAAQPDHFRYLRYLLTAKLPRTTLMKKLVGPQDAAPRKKKIAARPSHM